MVMRAPITRTTTRQPPPSPPPPAPANDGHVRAEHPAHPRPLLRLGPRPVRHARQDGGVVRRHRVPQQHAVRHERQLPKKVGLPGELGPELALGDGVRGAGKQVDHGGVKIGEHAVEVHKQAAAGGVRLGRRGLARRREGRQG